MTTDKQLQDVNRRFYNGLWSGARVIPPERFNTWPLVSELAAGADKLLEVAPGLRPRLPLDRTQFLDVSMAAVDKLQAQGAHAQPGLISALPFADGEFDLVCAFDIVEHVQDDQRAFAELARVCKSGAVLLLSVPLYAARWTPFDEIVGHYRRYDPDVLQALLTQHGFSIERSAIYGMQPRSSRLLDLGMWFLEHRRQRALWWYNHVFMPLQTRFQKALKLVPGMIDTRDVDEVLLVCRRR